MRLGIVVFQQLILRLLLPLFSFYFRQFVSIFFLQVLLCTVSVGISLIFAFQVNQLSIRLNFGLICDLLPLVVVFMG